MTLDIQDLNGSRTRRSSTNRPAGPICSRSRQPRLWIWCSRTRRRWCCHLGWLYPQHRRWRCWSARTRGPWPWWFCWKQNTFLARTIRPKRGLVIVFEGYTLWMRAFEAANECFGMRYKCRLWTVSESGQNLLIPMLFLQFLKVNVVTENSSFSETQLLRVIMD